MIYIQLFFFLFLKCEQKGERKKLQNVSPINIYQLFCFRVMREVRLHRHIQRHKTISRSTLGCLLKSKTINYYIDRSNLCTHLFISYIPFHSIDRTLFICFTTVFLFNYIHRSSETFPCSSPFHSQSLQARDKIAYKMQFHNWNNSLLRPWERWTVVAKLWKRFSRGGVAIRDHLVFYYIYGCVSWIMPFIYFHFSK